MAASRPTRKTRKFDVHACEAGMNIKFPALLGRQANIREPAGEKRKTVRWRV
jgi:hypothetical protein